MDWMSRMAARLLNRKRSVLISGELIAEQVSNALETRRVVQVVTGSSQAIVRNEQPDATGLEPATRILVRAFPTGHTVQVLPAIYTQT